MWRVVSLAHSKTSRHKRQIYAAKKIVDQMVDIAPRAYAAFSGGKDSTAMIHLLAEHGVKLRVMSIKDDLDFPGEEELVQTECDRLGLEIDILHPLFSLQQWLSEHSGEVWADEDMHGRHAAFSKAAFYDVIDRYRESEGTPGVYLGLRKRESHGRLMNRIVHGAVYQKKETGEWVAQPLCDWEGIDVYAYLFAHNAQILDVYRCCRLHESPERIRKSWWLPGADSRHGGMVWLKCYYPSLFYRLCEILPDASRLA